MARTVLIVDDSPTIRSGVRRLLEGAGYQVIAEAADGSEAADCYFQTRPDVVTLDLEMRPVDGFGALERICSQDPAARIIVLTSAFRRSNVLKALQLGAGYVLKKPPERARLLEAVRRLLESPSPLSNSIPKVP